ncbi:WD40 repeat domain-containing protein [Lignipirellula cremea]|uniref:Translocation protein TolB n=1 Tax=Lignipirellula cremea TaxID=2528010 RepID=A0A518E0L1_9BACT|nr:WD40 repeat domain-containing protein [Lignipirellula cremea]QDU97632.1 hypothetical protein Pla8534_54820 [Lignipirellula cremea]
MAKNFGKCPQCQTLSPVVKEDGWKKLACSACGAEVLLERAAKPAPAASSAPRSTMFWLLLGAVFGIGGPVLLAGCMAAGYFLTRSPDLAQVDQPTVPVAAARQKPPAAIASANETIPPDAAAPPAEAPAAQTGPSNASTEPLTADATEPASEETSPAGPPLADPGQTGWQVTPDPAATVGKVERPDFKIDMHWTATFRSSLALSRNRRFLFEETTFPNSYVWDLFTGEKVLTTKFSGVRELRISPDGVHAAHLGYSPQDVIVRDLARKENLLRVPAKGSTPFFDFVQPNLLLVCTEKNGWALHRIDTQEVIWKTPSGLLKASTISPGSAWLAAVGEDLIEILDLRNGAVAGKIPIKHSIGSQKALAFSPDGTQLAFLDSSKLTFYSMLDGSPLRTLEVEHAETPMGFYQGPALAWLEDQSGLLINGFAFVTAQHAEVVYRIPDSLVKDLPKVTRIPLDAHYLLENLSDQETEKGLLHLIPVPRDAIREGERLVQESTLPPALDPYDWKTAPRVLSLGAPISADFEIDAAPIHQVSPPLDLGTDLDKVYSLEIVEQFAVVQRHIDPDNPKAGNKIVLHDLSLKQRPLEFQPPAPGWMRSMTPDATRVAFRTGKYPGRVDVWSVADGKHVAGWSPYPHEERHGVLLKLMLIDQDHALTTCSRNELVLWRVDKGEIVYRLSLPMDAPLIFSARRRYLAAQQEDRLVLVETHTGKIALDVSSPELRRLKLISGQFSPDGRQLAVTLTDGQNHRLAIWNLATKELEGIAPAPLAIIVGWSGNDHVIAMPRQAPSKGLHVSLFDARKRVFQWMYLATRRFMVTGSCNGQFWHVVQEDDGLPCWLTAYPLPDPDTGDLLTQEEPTEALLPATARVEVEVKFTPLPDETRKGFDQWTDTFQDQVRKQLNVANRPAGDEEPAWRLQLVAREEPTDRVIKRKALEAGQGEPTEVVIPVSEVQAHVRLLDPAGKTVAQSKVSVFTPSEFPGAVPPPAQMRTVLSLHQWQRVHDEISQRVLPRITADALPYLGLGASILAVDGPEPVYRFHYVK